VSCLSVPARQRTDHTHIPKGQVCLWKDGGYGEVNAEPVTQDLLFLLIARHDRHSSPAEPKAVEIRALSGDIDLFSFTGTNDGGVKQFETLESGERCDLVDHLLALVGQAILKPFASGNRLDELEPKCNRATACVVRLEQLL